MPIPITIAIKVIVAVAKPDFGAVVALDGGWIATRNWTSELQFEVAHDTRRRRKLYCPVFAIGGHQVNGHSLAVQRYIGCCVYSVHIVCHFHRIMALGIGLGYIR